MLWPVKAIFEKRAATVEVDAMRRKNINLPEKFLPELFLKLPLPDLSFSELISKNYPIPSVLVWVAWHYPPKTPDLVELFSGVAPANQTKERAKTRSSWISPIFMNSGVFP